MMLAPGIRVVRGPDWVWSNQDDGEGHVGTVCEIGRIGSTHSPERTVVVNWDCGNRTNYRVGYQGQYDLIVIDNAQIGVKHQNIICDGCKTGIAGIRFRCAQCQNYDLCSYCYGGDVHDLDHPFIRYQTSNSVGVPVPPRVESSKLGLLGIFVGARVERGPDWEWGPQDGGKGKSGRVMEIRGWDNESCRSVANVSWISGSTNVYRLGHKGNVDLKYLLPSLGGYYYKDHMPVLGQPEEEQPVVSTSKSRSFTVGDQVKVCLDKDILMKLQQGHGGWNPRMAEFLNKIGVVHRITDKGDIRVQYDGCSNRWTYHPASLVRVYKYQVGDLVTIIDDVSKVQQLQRGHGDWVDAMRPALGKTCRVIKVYSDGDIRVQEVLCEACWTLNPKCVRIAIERAQLFAATERSNSMMDLSHQRSDHTMAPLSGLSGTSAADKLVRGAAQGRLDFVKNYLQSYPDQVDVMSSGKTCLHIAAHQGHVALVNYLISVGANVNIVDREGDSTLHYAAFGNQPEVMKILLQNNANINFLNSSQCSALHISAHKKPPHCVRVLLEFGADVNIQDSYGDTALHDAIGKENFEVVELLCNAPNLNVTVTNNRGFNVLHHASLKGKVKAAKKILQIARQQLVDERKGDGFAALHLAALNGHAKVVEELVKDGKAEIDIRNNRRQTPFLLAISQGHAGAVECLVDLGCDINAKDEDGDNAMHLCIIKKSNLTVSVGTDAPKIFEIYQTLSHINENRVMYAILCYLAMRGCRIESNNKGVKIFDWIGDKDMQDLILSYEARKEVVTPPASSQDPSNVRLIVSNIQSLTLSEDASSSSIPSDHPEQNLVAADISSNPPTPVRRNRINNNREISTPSPSSNLQQDDNQRKVATISPPPPPISGGATNNLESGDPTHQSPPQLPNLPSRNIKESSGGKPETTTRQSRKQTNTVSKAPSNQPEECIVCNEVLVLITFQPCYHQISCEECGIRMKKCLSCGTVIEKRISTSGKVVCNKGEPQRQPSADRLRYLESKIMEIEETHCCSICMERRRNVAFLCGHGACSRCAETLKICHMCRKTIVKKINLY